MFPGSCDFTLDCWPQARHSLEEKINNVVRSDKFQSLILFSFLSWFIQQRAVSPLSYHWWIGNSYPPEPGVCLQRSHILVAVSSLWRQRDEVWRNNLLTGFWTIWINVHWLETESVCNFYWLPWMNTKSYSDRDRIAFFVKFTLER